MSGGLLTPLKSHHLWHHDKAGKHFTTNSNVTCITHPPHCTHTWVDEGGVASNELISYITPPPHCTYTWVDEGVWHLMSLFHI